ncbi:hypothetical protein DPMN_072488 [Dreissena polymorpha]|uniref:GIY-YIG domain-containing protein n=1 Tax=Dreissena polymorpha TaxID=45954 RepID=A0A9D3Z425_DREPO|nr:hypothetical protein DPMN_072488 [Dreissena polymorpha]
MHVTGRVYCRNVGRPPRRKRSYQVKQEEKGKRRKERDKTQNKSNGMTLTEEIPCRNCETVYIGETGRKLGTRMTEHKKEAKNSPQVFTRSGRRESGTTEHSSAVTNHIARHNHVIDWDWVKVIDRENNTALRKLRESVAIANERRVMNRDEGGYQLSPI